jgi:DNA-binding response OmpR family regulator
VALLTNRSPAEALPALSSLGLDVKVESLDEEALSHLKDLSPSVVAMDAVTDPDRAFSLLAGWAAEGANLPVVVILAWGDLERLPWAEVADEWVHPSASEAELQVRLAMLRRRTGGGEEGTIRLGPLSLNTLSYQVQVAGRVIDLLRFLVHRPGRVFTRTQLLAEVWGYNFYGGTRTVDVHVRRLRAKLGVEHEALIQTVRGVGYRAAEPGPVERWDVEP